MCDATYEEWKLDVRGGYAFLSRRVCLNAYGISQFQPECSIPIKAAVAMAKQLMEHRHKRIVLDVREAMDAG